MHESYVALYRTATVKTHRPTFTRWAPAGMIDLDDPAGRTLDEVRRIRGEIDGRVRALLSELVPDG